MDSRQIVSFKRQLNDKCNELYLDLVGDVPESVADDLSDIRSILDDIEATYNDD